MSAREISANRPQKDAATGAVKDPRPASAVSSGAGLAGLLGLAAWVMIARQYGMDGPYSALVSVAACGLPMVIWSLLNDKVHLRKSTGIDWKNPKPLKETFDISVVKLAGIWATWGAIAIIYCLGRWYWSGQYLFAMEMMQVAAPLLIGLSIPYVMWLDRYLKEPRDGSWHFGQFIMSVPDRGRNNGSETAYDREQIYHHLRAWAVKGFFIAFMISIVPGGFGDLIRLNISDITGNPVAIAQWLIIAMFVVDVQFATVGYMLTMKPLDSHIRTANPYLAGWVAALLCYPPFALMYPGGPLHYNVGNYGDNSWNFWLADYPAMLWIWGGALVILTAIYAWATVAFGLRFSNLTHRGILTHGPYRFTKHPAYVAKNTYWWLATIPFLVIEGSWTDSIRNTAIIAAVSGVYYWRAKTEEKHLLADPAYKEYAEWMDRNAPIPRAVNWMKVKIGWWDAPVSTPASPDDEDAEDRAAKPGFMEPAE